jgi:hypothetical protein
MIFERLGSAGLNVILIDTFETAVAVSAYSIRRTGIGKSIYWANRLSGRPWRVHQRGIILGQHVRKCVIDIAWKFDAFMVRDEMCPYFAMVDAATAFHTYEGVMSRVNDQPVSVK